MKLNHNKKRKYINIGSLLHFKYGHNPFNAQTNHHYIQIEIPENMTPPSIAGAVKQDPSGTWYVEIQTENFTFTPENVGLEQTSYNEGHAHLYLNGKRMNRMYCQYYNLGKLKKGKYKILVTLNANNHGLYTYEGKPIVYEETIIIGE